VLAATVALAIVAALAASPAIGTVVTLTVEASSDPAPLFAGSVDTAPHAVDGGDGSGPHPCWGPPGATPAATATGALDDALRAAGITWRGNWDPSFNDFFIDRIGSHSSVAPDRYWSLSINGHFSAGGCLTRVAEGDTVRFFYGPLFGAPPQDDPPAPGQPSGEGGRGSSGGPLPARIRHAALGRIARRATRFLRGSGGIGEEWADLALALRGRHDLSGGARRLGGRLRALPGKGAIGLDVDSAALAAWSLAMRGRHAQARKAAAFVRSAQTADGGFPTMPGGTSNAQSTGVALVALRVTGLGPRPTPRPGGSTPLDYLASLAGHNGSIAYMPGASPTPVWTTAQALLGLTTRAKLLRFAAGGGGG
jgi:hypothetical protein